MLSLKKLLKKNPITNIFNIPLRYSFFFSLLKILLLQKKNNGNEQTWLQHSDTVLSGCHWYIIVDEFRDR